MLTVSLKQVPLVTSDCDDEATIFSLSSSNGTLTDAQVGQYIQSNYIKGTDEEIEQLLLLYPQGRTPFHPHYTFCPC